MVLNVKNKNYSDSAQRDIENYFDQLGESDQISQNDGLIKINFI